MATPQNADCVLGSSTVGAALQLNCTIALTSVGDEQSQTSAYRNFYIEAKPDVLSYVTFVIQTSFAIFQNSNMCVCDESFFSRNNAIGCSSYVKLKVHAH